MITKEYETEPDPTDVQPVPVVRCDICGQAGSYGDEIVDTDIIDTTGHEDVMAACRDTKACYARLIKQEERYS